jgi:hypothetical protein
MTNQESKKIIDVLMNAATQEASSSLSWSSQTMPLLSLEYFPPRSQDGVLVRNHC